MKKMTAVVFVALLLLSSVTFTTGAETIKILVDESRVYGWSEEEQEILMTRGFTKDTDWTFSFENEDMGWGYSNVAERFRNIGSVDIKEKGKLGYSTLRNYDVLVIASYEESYSSAEMEAVKQFVENGGSLLLLADDNFPYNSVSRDFGVLFYSESVWIASKSGQQKTFRYLNTQLTISKEFFFYIEDIESHPVTSGIDKIAFVTGVPITSYESGRVLARTGSDTWADKIGDGMGSQQDDEDSGPFDVIVAMEMGKGRALFIGSAESFRNSITENESENLDLLENAVEWLGEPGGPYKQYKAMNEQAQQVFSEAVSLYESHQFSQAKSKFGEAIGVFEESAEVYPNAEANKGIEDANDYIGKCETGIEADEIFSNAQDLYNKREYEKAIEEYEKAKSLYEEIEYTERVQECSAKIDESNDWIALREEAKSLFQEGEDALTTAPSTFSTKGFEDAKSIFEQAKSKWEEYDDPAQVTACEEKIDYCDDEIASIKQFRILVIVGVGVVIVVVVVVIVVVRKRKPKVEVTPRPERMEETVSYAEAEEALEALKDRYARGEITKEEFEKLKSVLEKT